MDSQQTMDFEPHDTGAENGPGQQASTQVPPIPNLPPSPQFESFEDLYDFLQIFHRTNGAALIKLRTRKKAGVMTSCVFACDRDSRQPSQSVGLRKTATQKLDCPVRINASTSQKAEWKWTYVVTAGQHNHGQSLDPSAHNIHRRRTPAQIEAAKQVSNERAVRPRELGNIVRNVEGGTSYFRAGDIYNDRNKIKRDALGGLTPTQAFIKALEIGEIKHRVLYDEDRKVKGVFWTYEWCEKMWKRFPEVLGLDNTYKTNRFKMYLFQATGITDQGSLANFAFGLINTETLEGFQWLCEQLNSLRLDVQAPAPKVVITDYEKALRKALNNLFPYTQQQLCVYHINTNVRSRIRSRWNKGKKNKENNSDEPARNIDDELEYWDSLGFSDDSDVSDDSDDSDESQSEGEPDLDIAGRTSTQEEAEEAFHHPPSTTNPQATENTWEGMFEACKKVVYAAKEADFEQAWQYMKTTFGKDQLHTLRYIVCIKTSGNVSTVRRKLPTQM